MRSGHGAWVARFVATEPAVATLPKPAERAVSASRAPVALGPCAPGHVLVRLAPGADPAVVAARLGYRLGAPTGTGSWRFAYEAATTPAGAAAKAGDASKRLRADPDVLWSEPDWVVRPLALPDDPELSRQWHLRATGATVAWATSRGDPDVVVAVVDTGIVPHPDLEGRVVPGGVDFVSEPTVAGDGDGIDLDPTDVGDQDDSSGFSSWHGTFVSALVCAGADDGVGGAGVAPDCRVLPLRALGIGGGYVSDVAAAVLWAAGITSVGPYRLEAPVSVINLSLGVGVYSAELDDACTRASNVGCFLVGAAGNDGDAVQYPAALDEVVAVGAVDQGTVRAYYSSMGPELDLVAPGGNSREDQNGDGWPDGVLSATLDETVHPRVPSHRFRDGTSAAEPQVAGAAALLWSIDPTLTPVEVRTLLVQSALDRGVPGRDDAYGHGLLQVHEAVRRLLAQNGSPISLDPGLHLLQGSVKLHGLESSRDVLVSNAGGGLLTLVSAQPITDDGGGWLNATFVPHDSPTSSDTFAVRVLVDRSQLPSGPERWSGTLRLSNLTAPIGTIRVVVYVQARQRAGSNFTVLPEEVASGIVSRRGVAAATASYRYWIRDVGSGGFHVRAGEDLDGDGLICENAEACGWHGGPTEADATLVVVAGEVPATGVDVALVVPP
jgi:serine protease